MVDFSPRNGPRSISRMASSCVARGKLLLPSRAPAGLGGTPLSRFAGGGLGQPGRKAGPIGAHVAPAARDALADKTKVSPRRGS